MNFKKLSLLLALAGPMIIIPRPKPPSTMVRAPRQRNMNGWYLHKSTKTWRHDGGTHPDTNYPEQNKDREYLQLEDPEGVYERTKNAPTAPHRIFR